MVIKQNNKVTPEEMIRMIRNREKIIKFPRFWALNEKLRIKRKLSMLLEQGQVKVSQH